MLATPTAAAAAAPAAIPRGDVPILLTRPPARRDPSLEVGEHDLPVDVGEQRVVGAGIFVILDEVRVRERGEHPGGVGRDDAVGASVQQQERHPEVARPSPDPLSRGGELGARAVRSPSDGRAGRR